MTASRIVRQTLGVAGCPGGGMSQTPSSCGIDRVVKQYKKEKQLDNNQRRAKMMQCRLKEAKETSTWLQDAGKYNT
uniref:Uncharacterized protein n=1 Tax=Oryza nivara TaxID=4536 RepID=A0A0E0IU38_ORYNI